MRNRRVLAVRVICPRALAAAAVLLALCLTVGLSATSAAGFGTGGRLVTGFGSYPQTGGSVADLAVAADGRTTIAVEGAGGQPIQVAVLAADGSLDTSFSEDGLVAPQLEPGRPFRREPVQVAFDGGSLLVAGTIRGPKGNEVELRKYSPDGGLDRGFGKGGVATVDFPKVAALFVEPSGEIALFADGHYVAGEGFSPGGFVAFGPKGTPQASVSPPGVGTFGNVSIGADGSFLAAASNGEEPLTATILRLGAEGQLLHQVSFTEGQVFLRQVIGETAEGAALAEVEGRPDRLLADDSSPDPAFQSPLVPCPRGENGGRYSEALPEPDGRIVLFGSCGIARIEADGAPDPTFTTTVPNAGELHSVAVGPGGSVLYATWNEAAKGAEVVRLGPGGGADPSFGSGGRALVHLRAPVETAANALIVAPGGDLIAAGGAACGPECGGFALARYAARGQLDRGFGRAGRVLDSDHELGAAKAVAIAPNGDILAAGTNASTEGGGSGQHAFALAEFRPSGDPDRRFGRGGVVVDQISPSRGQRSEINAVAVQPDGRIVVAGLSEGCGRHGGVCFTVARFLPSGSFDRSFADDGVLRLTGTRGSATAIALAPGGEIVVTGGEGGHFLTIRLNRRGRLDPSFGHRGIVDHLEKIRFHERHREVIDLGLGADAVTVSRSGVVTVAGGSRSAHSVVERYRPNGSRDRRFGDGGQVFLPHLGVSDLAISRCGIVAAGTTKAAEREPQMSVVGIAASGRGQSRPLPLFGALRASDGTAVALTGGRAVVAGEVRPFEASGEFGLAAVPLRSLLPRC
jgi:uncharacterized delta-60 repeat protein